MAGSDSDGQAPSRKRSRTAASAGEDAGAGGRKARGRPRVDTQDETAADVSSSTLPRICIRIPISDAVSTLWVAEC